MTPGFSVGNGWASAIASLATLLFLAVAAGCVDAGADHMLLDRYFAASRLLDRTALADIATVVFEPSRDGIVTRFTVVAASEAGTLSVTPSAADAQTARVVELSLTDRAAADSPAPQHVALTMRRVSVDASVRSPSGAVSPRRLDVTLQRADAADSSRRRGRWIVTAIAGRP